MTEVSKVGIQETREFVDGMLDVTVLLAGAFKDGVQVSDAAYLWEQLSKDHVLKARLFEAYEGARKIPDEVRDIDLGEGILLAQTVLLRVPDLVSALQKKA